MVENEELLKVTGSHIHWESAVLLTGSDVWPATAGNAISECI